MLRLENINNDYIKLSSDFITNLLQNTSEYTSLKIDATINCCEDVKFSKEIDFEKKNRPDTLQLLNRLSNTNRL